MVGQRRKHLLVWAQSEDEILLPRAVLSLVGTKKAWDASASCGIPSSPPPLCTLSTWLCFSSGSRLWSQDLAVPWSWFTLLGFSHPLNLMNLFPPGTEPHPSAKQSLVFLVFFSHLFWADVSRAMNHPPACLCAWTLLSCHVMPTKLAFPLLT